MPTIQKQSVAEHSFNVTSICFHLLVTHKGNTDAAFRLRVIEYAIGHDKEEAATGDRPSTDKDGSREDPKELPQYKIIVKVADMLEACLFAAHERTMGNKSLESINVDLLTRLSNYWRYFEWSEEFGPKPTSDVILSALVKWTDLRKHPSMEDRE